MVGNLWLRGFAAAIVEVYQRMGFRLWLPKYLSKRNAAYYKAIENGGFPYVIGVLIPNLLIMSLDKKYDGPWHLVAYLDGSPTLTDQTSAQNVKLKFTEPLEKWPQVRFTFSCPHPVLPDDSAKNDVHEDLCLYDVIQILLYDYVLSRQAFVRKGFHGELENGKYFGKKTPGLKKLLATPGKSSPDDLDESSDDESKSSASSKSSDEDSSASEEGDPDKNPPSGEEQDSDDGKDGSGYGTPTSFPEVTTARKNARDEKMEKKMLRALPKYEDEYNAFWTKKTALLHSKKITKEEFDSCVNEEPEVTDYLSDGSVCSTASDKIEYDAMKNELIATFKKKRIEEGKSHKLNKTKTQKKQDRTKKKKESDQKKKDAETLVAMAQRKDIYAREYEKDAFVPEDLPAQLKMRMLTANYNDDNFETSDPEADHESADESASMVSMPKDTMFGLVENLRNVGKASPSTDQPYAGLYLEEDAMKHLFESLDGYSARIGVRHETLAYKTVIANCKAMLAQSFQEAFAVAYVLNKVSNSKDETNYKDVGTSRDKQPLDPIEQHSAVHGQGSFADYRFHLAAATELGIETSTDVKDAILPFYEAVRGLTKLNFGVKPCNFYRKLFRDSTTDNEESHSRLVDELIYHSGEVPYEIERDETYRIETGIDGLVKQRKYQEQPKELKPLFGAVQQVFSARPTALERNLHPSDWKSKNRAYTPFRKKAVLSVTSNKAAAGEVSRPAAALEGKEKDAPAADASQPAAALEGKEKDAPAADASQPAAALEGKEKDAPAADASQPAAAASEASQPADALQGEEKDSLAAVKKQTVTRKRKSNAKAKAADAKKNKGNPAETDECVTPPTKKKRASDSTAAALEGKEKDAPAADASQPAAAASEASQPADALQGEEKDSTAAVKKKETVTSKRKSIARAKAADAKKKKGNPAETDECVTPPTKKKRASGSTASNRNLRSG